MRKLEEENLELMKALHETNVNLKTALYAYRAFLAHLRKTMTDAEIDKLLVIQGKAKIILPAS